jgi:Family of unknown function (DUF5317)
MFALYAVLIGILAGATLGGRLSNLGDVRVRWAPAALIGLLIQVVLFLGPVAGRIGDFGAPIYVGSSALVLVVVLRNLAIPGLPIVAAGAASNLAAILANGGYMPAAPAALEALGKQLGSGYSNSVLAGHAALAPLTDIFALPAGVPFANVFSVGDLLIASGVVWAVVALMRSGGASRNLRPKNASLGTDEP